MDNTTGDHCCFGFVENENSEFRNGGLESKLNPREPKANNTQGTQATQIVRNDVGLVRIFYKASEDKKMDLVLYRGETLMSVRNNQAACCQRVSSQRAAHGSGTEIFQADLELCST
jgi:hypothetical protein